MNARSQFPLPTGHDMAMQALRHIEAVRSPACRPVLESVESLRLKVLSAAQKDAMADIQDAIVVLEETAQAINQLILLHGLDLRILNLWQSGMMNYAIETQCSESRVAEAKLLRGGQSLRAEQPQAIQSAAREERAA
ncbi:hypothetical protein [Chromobacterium sp. IIBBL 290-4]|uniref:hypothetical protein n=1 Tax=Chromobacterium sp. IIBBL 290-4 TaxID=2953890 RepID=UPI0020B66619|nr:hypothetical protein [Chromobacterium sp. IIBBL 290-4]UTH73319.1 hypothetical protein NKT35_17530 [Chromobacterium sp. IIBBL 290-4]